MHNLFTQLLIKEVSPDTLLLFVLHEICRRFSVCRPTRLVPGTAIERRSLAGELSG